MLFLSLSISPSLLRYKADGKVITRANRANAVLKGLLAQLAKLYK